MTKTELERCRHELGVQRAAHQVALGLALLRAEGSHADASKDADVAKVRKLIADTERQIVDVESMLLALPAWERDQDLDGRVYAAATLSAAKAQAARRARQVELATPSTARPGNSDDYGKEKRRFRDDYDAMKGSETLLLRARELMKLATSCGGTIEKDGKRFLKSHGASPELKPLCRGV